MRLFIAIPLNDEQKRLVRKVQAAFRSVGVRGNYTPEENLHLTLAFIGEFGDPDRVLEAMETVRQAPFSIAMDQLGHFDDLWWMGYAESPELNRLAGQLRHALSDAGIPFDRKRFLPHVTVLRRAQIPPRGQMPRVSVSPQSMRADRICLLSSTRGKSGMIYREEGSLLL